MDRLIDSSRTQEAASCQPPVGSHIAGGGARRYDRPVPDDVHPLRDGDACCAACGHAADVERGVVAAETPGAPLVVRTDETGAPVDLVLVVMPTHGAAAPHVVPLRKAETTLGRGAVCDVVLPSAALSRRQMTLTVRGDALIVADAGSSCGTYLNGARIKEAPLRVGDKVYVADFILMVTAASSV